MWVCVCVANKNGFISMGEIREMRKQRSLFSFFFFMSVVVVIYSHRVTKSRASVQYSDWIHIIIYAKMPCIDINRIHL